MFGGLYVLVGRGIKRRKGREMMLRGPGWVVKEMSGKNLTKRIGPKKI